MDPNDSPGEAQFRSRVRDWLAATLPTLSWPEPAPLEEKRAFWSGWQRKLFDGGFAGLSWPTEYGGAGADAKIKAVFNEELDRAGAPERLNIIGEDFAGPTIVAFGSGEQKQRYLEPILRGTEIWCQLFSEPESGSDLASLRTKATKVDGGWRIQGQKIWTSRAQIADNAILLARTGGGDRHKGITYFLLPMDSAGITVRPLAHMLGEAEFNEVFLDDVFVPDAAVVGEVDGGWRVAMGTLAFERVGIATGRVNTTRAVRDLVEQISGATDDDGAPLASKPEIRQRIADLYGRALDALPHRPAGRDGRGFGRTTRPGHVDRETLLLPLVEDIADFGLELCDLGGQFGLAQTDTDAPDPVQQRWLRLAYQARGTAIAGGSTFIQRNIAAERVLGMPRG